MAGGDLVERLPAERPTGVRRVADGPSTDDAAEPAKADHMHVTHESAPAHRDSAPTPQHP
ncbi:hypothetical protein [Streptomyces sp. HM190]|uniref:hypothetical protein n=1 Tax=Streptomyces sp. HM190 TaxID=2695266 RepID=UPI001356A5AA|nr:hypothetical protein [Streptomyces sp. HM190]